MIPGLRELLLILPLPRTDIFVARKWNELNDWQLSIIGRILYNDKALEKPFFRNILVFVLILNKPGFFNLLKAFYLLTMVPFSDLMHHTNFIFDEGDNLNRFLPKIKVKRKIFPGIYRTTVLYGPAVRLSNIITEELSYADTFYYNWTTKGNNDDLRRLVACLYRPSGSGSTKLDPRDEFQKLLLPQNSNLTDLIPMHLQYVIGLSYQGTRRGFQAKYKKIFPVKLKSEDPEEKEIPKKASVYQPFSKIAQAMAMDDVQIFGTLDQTNRSNAIEFLETYNELLIRESKK